MQTLEVETDFRKNRKPNPKQKKRDKPKTRRNVKRAIDEPTYEGCLNDKPYQEL